MIQFGGFLNPIWDTLVQVYSGSVNLGYGLSLQWLQWES